MLLPLSLPPLLSLSFSSLLFSYFSSLLFLFLSGKNLATKAWGASTQQFPCLRFASAKIADLLLHSWCPGLFLTIQLSYLLFKDLVESLYSNLNFRIRFSVERRGNLIFSFPVAFHIFGTRTVEIKEGKIRQLANFQEQELKLEKQR